ncbi:MAG: response regulator [Magnetococcales bacterium]|nr:response regulator [Magnetococcales bacterium]
MLRFGLPRRPANAGEGSGEAEGRIASVMGQSLAGVRILVVDSHPLGRTIAVEMLHGFGAEVGEAEEWEALFVSLEKAHQEHRPWEVLMLDQRMVEPNSAQLMALKDHPGWRGKAAVLLAANRRIDEFTGLAILPELIPVVKPLKRVSLLRCLKAILEGRMCELSLEPEVWPFVDPSLPSLRILLAEDLEENRELAAEILEKAGHQVVPVKDGQEALDRMMAGAPFDLVLTDLHMPRMDGYELTRRIREEYDSQGRIPIVAVTARALPGERALCMASGMDDFLVKPYRPVELLNVTARVAVNRRAKNSKGRAAVLSPVEDRAQFLEASGQLRKGGVAALLDPLRAMVDEKNVRRARELTETVKKMAVALGAERVKLKAIRLGVAVRAEEWLKAGKLFRELESECIGLCEALGGETNP